MLVTPSPRSVSNTSSRIWCSTAKDSINTYVSSLLDIPIQQETPQTQSLSAQKVPVSVIPETTNLPPIPKIVTETLVSTTIPSPQVTPIISIVQQTPTPIPTPPITTDAPTIITTVHESNALSAVELRVAKLEKDVSELKTVDHSSEAIAHLPELTKKLTLTTEQEYEKNDDDEDPPARPNKGKKTKRRRTKESESSKKPSSTKETPKGKAPTKGSKTGKSAPTKEPVEEPIAKVVMDDAGDDVAHDDNQPQDTSKPKTRKTLNPDWFKQPPRPPTPDLKWNKHQVVLDQPAQPWFNQMASALKDPLTFNDLMATPIDFSKYVLNGLKIENLTQDILLGPAFNQLKEGNRYPFDLSKPLPLQGPPGHRTVTADYFFNNDMEYLKTSNPELFHLDESVIINFIMALLMFTRSLILKRRVKDLQLGVESYQKKLNITKPQKTFPEIKFKEPYTPSYDPPAIVYEDLDKQKRVLRVDELYKFSDGTLKSVRYKIHHRVLDFHLDYNPEMPKRKWTAVDQKRSGLMIELIDKQLQEREIFRNLEQLVAQSTR
ncbi:hypothetical protein Tco_1465467 [Tanacetum coccineum]